MTGGVAGGLAGGVDGGVAGGMAGGLAGGAAGGGDGATVVTNVCPKTPHVLVANAVGSTRNALTALQVPTPRAS